MSELLKMSFRKQQMVELARKWNEGDREGIEVVSMEFLSADEWPGEEPMPRFGGLPPLAEEWGDEGKAQYFHRVLWNLIHKRGKKDIVLDFVDLGKDDVGYLIPLFASAHSLLFQDSASIIFAHLNDELVTFLGRGMVWIDDHGRFQVERTDGWINPDDPMDEEGIAQFVWVR